MTLHSAQAVHAEATAFFEPERGRILDLMDEYGADELALIARFVSSLTVPTSAGPPSPAALEPPAATD